MTADEWRETDDPGPMLEVVRDRASDRKLRLFACGCVRLVLNPFTHPGVVRAVLVAEAFADGRATVADLAGVERTPILESRIASTYEASILLATYDVCEPDAYRAADSAAWQAARAGADVDSSSSGDLTAQIDYRAERAAQADLLRDLFGDDPFHPPALDPNWRTDAVVGLAAGIYRGRAWDRLPVLADALEEAGCEFAGVLDHCRAGGRHARGCWVVDLVLGLS